MKGLRQLVLARLAGDSQMNGFGYDNDSLYPMFSRDAPPESVEGRCFGIIRWGTTERGVGRVSPVAMELWLYNKDPDWDPIDGGLQRARTILDMIIGVNCDAEANGWVLDVRWEGASPDGKDDLYDAIVRSESYTITASGN